MKSSVVYLQAWDYVIVVAGLTISSLYGLYHGVRSRKMTSKGATFEYLLASRNMGVLPIAFSYFATFASTATLIGFPTEVYTFGIQIICFAVMSVPSVVIINEIFLPVYYRLKSGSLYEYLELRFNSTIKSIVTKMAVFQTIVLSSANLYGTATVMTQVSGINSWFLVIGLATLCILYTTFGGIRAVILADVIQALFMLIALVLLLAFGIYYIGDVGLVYKRNLDTGRLSIFEFDQFNLNVRLTVWNTTIGYGFLLLSTGTTSQYLVQRLMTAPNIALAKRANLMGNLLFLFTVILTCSIGLVMYATFHGCDPLQSGLIQNVNQLVPAYLMKVLSSYMMLPGIFFTGILCATLSTLSSVYNSTATILFNMFPPMSDKRATLLCKTLVFTVGVLSTLGVALAEMFPNILQSVLSVIAAVGAPLFAMLLIGIFCPQANIKATCVSFTCSVCFLFYVIAGTLLVKPPLMAKSLLSDSCDLLINDTAWRSLINDTGSATTVTDLPTSDVGTNFMKWSTYFPFSSMSYLWYSAVGTLSTTFLFVIFSLFVGKEMTKPVNLEIIPEVVRQMHCKLPQRVRQILLCDVYNQDLQTALKVEAILSEHL